jgi:hypothetical protein
MSQWWMRKVSPNLEQMASDFFAVDMHSEGVTKNKPFEKIGMHS